MKPGPAISAVATPSRSAAATTAWATSRGLRPSALASGSAPLAWASARSDGRTTGSTPARPATASNAGCRRVVRTWRGSAIGTAHCGGSAPLRRNVDRDRGGSPWSSGRGRPLTCTPRHSRPRSSGDRASASGAVCAGSNPAEGAPSSDGLTRAFALVRASPGRSRDRPCWALLGPVPPSQWAASGPDRRSGRRHRKSAYTSPYTFGARAAASRRLHPSSSSGRRRPSMRGRQVLHSPGPLAQAPAAVLGRSDTLRASRRSSRPRRPTRGCRQSIPTDDYDDYDD